MAGRAKYDRDAVLAKARDLFWSKGYHATSLKDLEAVLDLRPGSIYAAFGSKEGLFAEALGLYARESREAFNATIAEADSPLSGLAAHVRSISTRCREGLPSRACMLAKTVLETPDNDPVLRRQAEIFLDNAEQAFAAAFEAARDAGELPQDAEPARLARRLQAEVIGLRAYAQRTGVEEATEALAEDIARDIEAMRIAPAA